MRLAAVLTILLCPATLLAAAEPLDEALRALRAPDARLRAAAAARLGRCGRAPACSRAVRALERSLFDPQPLVRRASCNALANLEARPATASVLRLLELERDPTVLAAALVTLGRLRAGVAMPAFVHHASDARPAVRAAAITGAADVGGPAARRLVANSLQMAGTEDADWAVRAAGLLALARMGEPRDLALARRAYVAGRGDRHWLARSAWARVVAALDPHPRTELERLMLDPDARVAVTAATGLVRAGLGDVVVAHLRHTRPAVRAAAIGGVRQGRHVRAYPRLRTVARHDASRRVRWAAIVALFAVGDSAGDELMLDALRSEEPAIWTEALGHLVRRSGGRSHGRDVRAWRRELARLRATGSGR